MRDLIAEGRERLTALSESPTTDRAFDLALWAGQNLAEILAELEAQRERVNELAAKRNPDDEVLVEDSWFHPDDLPKVLGNHMRSLTEERRRTKDMYIELEAARAAIARVAAMVDHGLHSEDPDEHDCDTHPCWAVALRKAIGIEETP